MRVVFKQYMAKKFEKKGKNNVPNRKNDLDIKLTDYLTYTPGVLMVGMIALMLVLNVVSTAELDILYEDFKNIFRVFDCIAIIAGLIFLASTAKKKKLKFCVRDYFFGVFMVCIVLSTLINGLSHEAAFGKPSRCIGVLNMIAFFIVYMKVSGYIERVSFRHTVLMGYLAVADAIALSALYEKYLGDIQAYKGKTEVSTIFINSNHYGYFLAMAIMISIGYYMFEVRKKAVFGALSAIVNIFVLVLNNTIGAILAVGICTSVTVLLVLISEMNSGKIKDEISEKRALAETAKRAVILLILAVAGVIATLGISSDIRSSVVALFHDIGSIIAGMSTGTEGSGRWLLWRTVAQYIAEKPLFGYGCEGVSARLFDATGMGDAHCEPLTYAAYYGIPGAVLYLAGVFTATIKYFKDRHNLPSYCRSAFLGAAAYFISSLVGVPMFNTMPFFFIFMGMAAEEWKEG